MSTGGGGLGSGEFYGRDSGDLGGQGGGLGGGLGALGGLLGSMGGSQGGMGSLGGMGPRGQFGLWPSCGCSSIIIILAGVLLVCGGCLSMFHQ